MALRLLTRLARPAAAAASRGFASSALTSSSSARVASRVSVRQQQPLCAYFCTEKLVGDAEAEVAAEGDAVEESSDAGFPEVAAVEAVEDGDYEFAATTDALLGKVKWFDKTKGYGFIVRDDGGSDVFVHFTSLHWRGRGRRSLAEDEPVEFTLQEDGKAEHVTGPAGKFVRGDGPVMEECPAPDEEGVFGGNVKWFDTEKGYGFITPLVDEMDDVFVHRTSIIANQRYPSLAEGEPVWFSVNADGVDAQRASARDVTGPGYAEVRGQPVDDMADNSFEDFEAFSDNDDQRY